MATDPPGPVDPDRILDRTFSTVRRGVDPAEVERYLRQIADQMRALAARVVDLERELEGERHRPAVIDPIDPTNLTKLVGEETARVLDAAQGAAAEIRARAEENVARMLREAREEASRMREDSETLVARRTEEAEIAASAVRDRSEIERARAEAEITRIIDEAKQRGRDMLAEAQQVRQRMLDDLARRRQGLREQLEQLQVSRDRLVAAYDVVRDTLAVATEELQVALPDERLAAESASLRAVEAELEATITPIVTAEDVGRSHPTVAEAPPAEGRAPHLTVVPPVEESTPEPTPTAERAAEPVAKVAPKPVPRPAAEPDAKPDANPDAKPDAKRDAGSDTEPDAKPGTRSRPSVAPAPKPDTAPAAKVARAPEPSPSTRPAPATEPAAPSRAATRTEPTTAAKAERASRPTPTSERRSEPTPATGAGRVVRTGKAADVFARLREEGAAEAAERDEAKAAAKAARSTTKRRADEGDAAETGAPDTAKTAKTASTSTAEPAAKNGTTTATPAEPEPAETVDEQAVVAARNAAVAPIVDTLNRRLKRELSDEQNELLARVGTVKRNLATIELLPTPEMQLERYEDLILPALAEAATAGAAMAPVEARGSVHTSVGDLASDLAASIVGSLRDRLDRAIVESAGDRDDLSKRIRSTFREWKGQRVDDVVEYAVLAACNRGLLERLPKGSKVRWVMAEGDDPSPDCEDNSLAGAVDCGRPFPTGHDAPPLHPGCHCVVLPVTD